MDADLSAATALARQAVGAPDDLPARAVRVRRLDRDASYVLVELGAPGTPGWVAAVDPVHHDVMGWGLNPSGRPTAPALPVDAVPVDAVPVDAVPADAVPAEYVWAPSALSRSPLYPLLRIATDAGVRYVDLAGVAHESLGDARG